MNTPNTRDGEGGPRRLARGLKLNRLESSQHTTRKHNVASAMSRFPTGDSIMGMENVEKEGNEQGKWAVDF